MSHLPIGTVLKSSQHSYVVEAVLGKGGFGVTYKVSSIRKVGNVEARCTFAIKELFISDWCEREAEGNEVTYSTPLKDKVENCKIDFLAEARRLQQISHSSIVAVDEVFEANNTAYYVMEYLDMGNLSDYVSRNGCLSEDEVMRLLLPVFNAVKTLHEHRMTHLDIKPANIMMKESDDIIRPVLIDFGLSKHYDEQGNATSTVRTQGCSDGYAPIEQYAGIETFSPESDIYALGATMVYCFTGQHPPRAVDLDEEGVNALLPSTISQNMRNAITKAMRGARSKRTKSMMEFVEDVCGDKVTSESSVVVNEPESSAPSTTPIETSSTTQVFGNDSATQVSGAETVTQVSEKKVTILGYKEEFVNTPAVKVFRNGMQIGKVEKDRKIEIDITEECILRFKCSFRSTECLVKPGDWVLLSINRSRGKLNAIRTDENNIQTVIAEAQKSDRKRSVLAAVMVAVMFLLAVILRAISG